MTVAAEHHTHANADEPFCCSICKAVGLALWRSAEGTLLCHWCLAELAEETRLIGQLGSIAPSYKVLH